MEAPEKIYLSKDLFRWSFGKASDKSDIEYTRTDAFIKKAKEAFCKATCNGHPPRSFCTILGMCKKHENFENYMKGE